MIKNFLVIFLFVYRTTLSADDFPASKFVLDQFQKYNIIAIDEGPHGTLQAHEFLRQLLTGLDGNIQYLILEFLNTAYQPVIDKYINGQDVSVEELQLAWRNSTQAHSMNFEKQCYIKLLETIRNINSKLPVEKRIHVLAGDPLINWQEINTINQYFSAISQRDVLPSELAIQYGIDSGKKVMLIYGGEHLKKTSSEKKDSTYWTIPYYINKKYPGSIFTIGIYNTKYYPENSTVALNSIIDLNNDSLGLITINADNDKLTQIKNVFDALYYVGLSDVWQEDFPLPVDPVYWEELNRRAKIIWGEGLDINTRKKK